jgi:hypothetical protein
MTSLCRELDAEQDIDAFATTLGERFGEVYERTPVHLPAAELSARVAGIEALAAQSPAPVP